MSMKYLKKYDVLIIVFVILLGGASLGLLKPTGNAHTDKAVYIYSDNELIKVVQIGEETSIHYNIEGQHGHNTVVVNEEGVYIEEADCPDLICVKDGMIRRVGEVLVCLPNKLFIEIKGSEKREIDGVSQ